MFQKKHPWFRRRGYPHFDQPIEFKKAASIVRRPGQVENHSFYPLIDFTVTTVKVKLDRVSGELKKIPKSRPIAYASHVDSHIYAYYSFLLTKRYEQTIVKSGLSSCVIAFRALGKSNIDFAADAFNEVKKRSESHVMCLDITGFFDNLDHLILKNAWSSLLACESLPPDHYAVFKSLTQYSKVDRSSLYSLLDKSVNNFSSKPERLCTPKDFRLKVRKNNLIKRHTGTKGIPQGSPISALLSNIYMLAFDTTINSYVSSKGGCYFRYCDDMFLIVPPNLKDETFQLVDNEIRKLKLEFQPKKTERIDFDSKSGQLKASKPLQYLGFIFDGQRVMLRSASLARYSDRMRRGIRLAKATMSKRNFARIGRGESPKPLFKKKIYDRYSYLGRRNFVSYGYKAAKKMESKSIKRQLGRLWKRVQNEIAK